MKDEFSVSGDLLRGWPNDDILFTQVGRDYVERNSPELFRVLDWPELREEFEKHDIPALQSKSANVKTGSLALIFSFLGLGISVLSTVNLKVETEVRSIAELFLLIGIFFGLWHLWRSRHKKVWLGHRFWTERLRQFYFQFIINNFDLALEATTDNNSKERYLSLRQTDLEELLINKPRTALLLEETISDVAETSPWINKKWDKSKSISSKHKNVAPLLEVLGRQRIGIQKEYTTRKIQSGFKSPTKRATIFNQVINFSTIGMIVLSAIAGILMFTTVEIPWLSGFYKPEKPWKISAAPIRGFFIGAGLLGVIIAMIKSVDEALTISVSAERYKWYLASVNDLDNRFTLTESPNEKIRILRELERLSYQEMRRFLDVNMNAKFGI